MAKKRIKRNDRYFNTYDDGGLIGKFANWNEAATNKFMGSGVGGALGKLGVSGSGLGGIANAAASTVSGLINPSGNSTGVGNALQGIGSIASNIPGIGGVIGAGVNLVGGLVNAAFGSNLNEEFIAQTEDKTKQQAGYTSSAKDNASLLSDWASYTDMAHVKKSQVGSDGWFSNKAKNKTKALNRAIDEANLRAWHSLSNTASNVDTNNDFLAMANFSAYGGPIFSTGAIGYDLATRDLNNKQMKALGDMRLTSLPNSFNAMPDVSTINTFSKGGGIHIKKKNRGKFTDYCGGKVTSECIQRGLHSSNPTTRKRANFARNARKWHSFGGWLNSQGGDFTNGVTFIDNGGSHEANPFEGVQMGIDPQGVPNLVEEGEVIFNDYVFSDRMKLPKKLKEKYSIKGETFADAAKELSKESEERPNDSISQRGLEAFMSALAESQEEVRIKNEDRRMNRYAKGGKLGKRFEGPGPDPNTLIPDWLWYDNSAFSADNKDDNHAFPIYAQSGVAFDTSDPYISPFTATINWDKTYSPDSEFSKLRNFYIQNWDNPNFRKYRDAYISALSKINGDMDLSKFTLDDFKRITNDRKLGQGHILTRPSNNVKALMDKLSVSPEIPNLTSLLPDVADIAKTPLTLRPPVISNVAGDNVTEVKGIRQNPLRYAPLIGSGIAVLNDIFGGNDPDYSNIDIFANAVRGANRPVGTRPIGEYLAYKPLDRMFYINQLNKNAAAGRRAVQNTSGGNRAAALAGILAADYNYGENLGQMSRQAEEYNQALKERVTGFNRQTNMFNSEQGTKVDMFNSELLGKQASLYGQLANMRQRILEGNRAEKSANLTNFIQGLGDLGRELTDRDTLRWLADIGALPYNTRGQYTGGNNTAAPKRSKGGKIKRNKRKGYTI